MLFKVTNTPSRKQHHLERSLNYESLCQSIKDKNNDFLSELTLIANMHTETDTCIQTDGQTDGRAAERSRFAPTNLDKLKSNSYNRAFFSYILRPNMLRECE